MYITAIIATAPALSFIISLPILNMVYIANNKTNIAINVSKLKAISTLPLLNYFICNIISV